MICLDLKDFGAALPPRGRLLGLDLGEKTIGIAVSDRDRSLASPLATLPRGKFTRDAEALKALCAEREITGMVLGLPVNMDGSEGSRCQATRQFARNLEKEAGVTLPIAFWDERLSTASSMSRRSTAAVDKRSSQSAMGRVTPASFSRLRAN